MFLFIINIVVEFGFNIPPDIVSNGIMVIQKNGKALDGPKTPIKLTTLVYNANDLTLEASLQHFTINN